MLFWCIWQNGPGFGLLRDHVQIEAGENVVDICDRVSAVLYQFIDARTTGREDRARHRKDFPPLIESRVGRNQGATFFGGFGHQHAKRETRDDVIASRKIARFWTYTE